MDILAAQVMNGLAIGSIYALVVTGMNLLLLVKGVIHFAYAHIVVISMYVTWIVLVQTNNNLALAIPAAFLTATLLSILTELVFRPLALRSAYLETVIISLGMAMILTDVMSHFIHHGRPAAFPAVLTGGGAMMKLGTIAFFPADAYTLLGCIGAVIALMYLLYHHRQGRAFRAIAQNVDIARLLGIPLNRTGIYSFAISGGLAGIISVLMAMSLGWVGPALGNTLAIKALVLILFAGMGNLKGGLVGALLIGLAEVMVMTYLPGRWTDAVVFGAIMIVIILKPQGLFGAQA